MKTKKKYLVKVYGGGNGRTLIKSYKCNTLKEARSQRVALNRYLSGYMNIVIDSVPLNEDEIK